MNVGYFTAVTFASNHLDTKLEKPQITADCGAHGKVGGAFLATFRGFVFVGQLIYHRFSRIL